MNGRIVRTRFPWPLLPALVVLGLALFAGASVRALTTSRPASSSGQERAAPADELRLVVLPEPAYLERSASGLLANWDLLVENAGPRAWTLTEVEVSAFDRGGALEWRRFVDGNGVSPGILTIPAREVRAHAELLVLNPLYSFPAD